jgi:hypothetical protein
VSLTQREERPSPSVRDEILDDRGSLQTAEDQEGDAKNIELLVLRHVAAASPLPDLRRLAKAQPRAVTLQVVGTALQAPFTICLDLTRSPATDYAQSGSTHRECESNQAKTSLRFQRLCLPIL